VRGARCLVTGGAGFVGSNLVKALLLGDVQWVHVVDNLLSAEEDNLPKDARVQFSSVSITNDELLSLLKDEYDYVFHLSTYHGNQSSIHNPLADHENNTLTTLKLFETIKHFKRLKKVIYSSAGCSVAEKTFGSAQATVESDVVPLDSDSPYSMSKIFGEFYSKYYFKQHELPVVRARFQNVYGPGEILGAGQWRGTPATVWRNVTPTFIFKALHHEALTVEHGGVATRDFIYVDDIVAGLMACALSGKAGDVYNLATGVETAILNLAEIINQLTENPTPISFLPKRPWDNSGKRFGSTERAKRELGFASQVSISEGLARTVSWTKANLPKITATMNKHSRHMNQSFGFSPLESQAHP
jgi:UDP-glucose 4-epimerase